MKKERNRERELKIGGSQMITISDNGVVSVPTSAEIRMTIGEIAELFGIYYQPAKKCIRTIEKSGVAEGDCTMSCTVEGMKIYPDYYGLEMIIAVAFRVQTPNAEIFRKWLIKKAVADVPKMKILLCRDWNSLSLN